MAISIPKRISILLLSLLFLNCAGTMGKKARPLDDQTLAKNVRAVLTRHDDIPEDDIFVSVRRSVVTLKGVLKTQQLIDKTIELVETQHGVKAVKAYLILEKFGKFR